VEKELMNSKVRLSEHGVKPTLSDAS
jgi:hypothetical protein